jgi:cell division protein FtsL
MPLCKGVCNILVVGDTLINKESNRMTIEVTVLISAVSVAFAIFFGLKSNRRNDVKEIEEKATRDATIIVKLDSISVDVKGIKDDMSNINKKVDEIDKRVVIVEQSTKSAHKRLDGIIGKREDRDNGDK